ncbi:FCD domain-containing protein [Streptomyces sp. NEAU-H3]
MLLDYRTVIETETARRAASLATPLEVREIRGSATTSASTARAADAYGFAEADAAFHNAVGAAAHNLFLRSSIGNIRRLAAQSDVLLFHGDAPGSLEVAAEQHLGIAEAVAAGDAERAAVLMAEHIATTRRQFERKIRDRLFHMDERTQPPGVPGQRADPPAASAS